MCIPEFPFSFSGPTDNIRPTASECNHTAGGRAAFGCHLSGTLTRSCAHTKGNRMSPTASVIMLTSGPGGGRQAETAAKARGNGGAILVTQTANWLWATNHHGS